jgi:hypothetical protein
LRRRWLTATIVHVELPFDRADVDAILSGLFHLNIRVERAPDELTAIRRLLEDDEQEEED